MSEQAETVTSESVFVNESHAVIEIMGHDRIAGRISKEAFGGTAFLRVDVPALPEEAPTEREGSRYHGYSSTRPGKWIRLAVPARPGFTKLFGGSAIFSMRLCSAEEALADELTRRERPAEEFIEDPDAPKALPAPDDELWSRDFEGNGDEQ